MAMLTELIKTFERATSEVESAVRIENEDLIREHDKFLRSAWNALIEYEPENTAERLELAKYLLANITNEFGDSHILEQIRDRVIQLISRMES